MAKRKLLVLSHVLPFPGSAGQQQRVYYTLRAARAAFHTTFVTTARTADAATTRDRLAELCDEPVVLPSRYWRSSTARAWHRGAASAYALWTGAKVSNYVIGRLEFAPARVRQVVARGRYDCVLLEYCHAAASIGALRDREIPCILDMHDILWRSRAQRLGERRTLPAWWTRHVIRQYREREEAAWRMFDGIVAINREEQDYVEREIPDSIKVFYAPMGTNLALWPASWTPSVPKRVAYYGSLGSPHNQRAALLCAREIMPEVWRHFPDVELWIVGSNPSAALRALTADPRVRVTGYLERVQPILRTMSLVLCPWAGTYGFRSRLVEAMALGVPVVATPDAVFGMELHEGVGVLLGDAPATLAAHSVRLLADDDAARVQSRLARAQVTHSFSMENTYDRLVRELDEWLGARGGRGHAAGHHLA